MVHQDDDTSAGVKTPSRKACLASVLMTSWSLAPMVSPVKVIACPVAAFTMLGSPMGPVTVMTGRVSMVPAFTQVTAESIGGTLPGNPAGKVTGSVSGLITGAGNVAVWPSKAPSRTSSDPVPPAGS